MRMVDDDSASSADLLAAAGGGSGGEAVCRGVVVPVMQSGLPRAGIEMSPATEVAGDDG